MLWESARAFFPGDNSLVSARKSHSPGVRGLVVRCLLFNPECSCSNPCVCANFLQVFRSRRFTFFGTETPIPFRLCETFFFESFLMFSKSSPFNLLHILQQNECWKIPKGPLFSDFSALRLEFLGKFLSKIFKRLLQVPFNFWKFCNRMDVEKSQSPFYSFRHCEIFQKE